MIAQVVTSVLFMLGAGIEPAWALAQGILSPSRLPVSPPERCGNTTAPQKTHQENRLRCYNFAPSACTAYQTVYAINPESAASPPLPTTRPESSTSSAAKPP